MNTDLKFYAGIGSRRTPLNVRQLMYRIGMLMARAGYVLRSGGAEGADTAFEGGCDEAFGKKEIFIPWNGFNGRIVRNGVTDEIPERAFDIAAKFHPVWWKLSQGAMRLHARNVLQILGPQLNAPVDYVVCWTPGAREVGGTAQAMRIAREYDITIYNLADPQTYAAFMTNTQGG